MKKLPGIIILFLSLCIVMPSRAQSAAGALIKTTTKEAREKIKEVTQAKTTAKKAAADATVKTGKAQQWGTTAKQDNGNSKTQQIIPVHPAPIDPVLLPRKHVFPVDTIGT